MSAMGRFPNDGLRQAGVGSGHGRRYAFSPQRRERMVDLPKSGDAPLIRSDFSDETAWAELLEKATAPSEHGFLANLHVINDRDFEGVSAEQIGNAARDSD